MKKMSNRYTIYLSLFVIISFIGCAPGVKLKFESMGSQPAESGSQITIHRLAENWTDYDIHFSGVSASKVQGILFDPKNDDKRLVPEGDYWKKVENKETMDDLLKWNASAFNYIARLMEIIHPDGQFFGYLYLNIEQNFAGFKVINDKTIAVFPVRKEGPMSRMSF